MCTGVFAWKAHPAILLLLTFNRDEFMDREAEAAHFWEDKPLILAGRDKQSGGTWLGVSPNGRFGFLTNYRELQESHGTPKRNAKSRGSLVTDFILGDSSPEEYMAGLECSAYSSFSLVVGSLITGDLHYLNSMECKPTPIPSGIHGLSNGDMADEHMRWRKVQDGKAALREILECGTDDAGLCSDPQSIIESVLTDQTKTSDPAALPSTHYPPDVERNLSSIFIDEFQLKGHPYGTRSQIVLVARADGRVEFLERSKQEGGLWEQRSFEFEVPGVQAGRTCALDEG